MTKLVEYYAYKSNSSSIGIDNKLRQTVETMNKNGYSAKLIYINSSAVHKYVLLSKLLIGSNADVIIIRNLPALITCSPILIALRMRGVKVIVDVPTPICVAVQELKSKKITSRKIIYELLFRLTFPFALWPASVVLQYSNESNWFKMGLNKKTKLIANGIDVNNIAVKKNNIYTGGGDFIMIAVASLASWHGFDRVIRGINELYQKNSQSQGVKLLIIGDGDIKQELEDLTNALGVESRVHFYGIQSGEVLSRLFDSAHLAISSLGLHRINLELASVLKSREYTARGIPFIATGADIDFSPTPTFVNIVPNDDSVINISSILTWYFNNVHNFDPNEIRNYAIKNLDYSIKINKILN